MYGNKPYTVHLEQVAASVKQGTTDERMVIVAFLHDILEDTACTPTVLAAFFEDNIVHAVVAITRTKGETKDAYLAKVKANHMARIVKIHDSLCNLRASVMRFDAKRIKKYTEQIAYLAADT
jgi:(p)ppGpp synthase/HD superfamily hydrolase